MTIRQTLKIKLTKKTLKTAYIFHFRGEEYYHNDTLYFSLYFNRPNKVAYSLVKKLQQKRNPRLMIEFWKCIHEMYKNKLAFDYII